MQHIKAGALLCIESTVSIGFTSLVAEEYKDRNVFVAYSPERIDPGNSSYTITNTPKIVSGIGPTAAAIATEFYSSMCEEVITANLPEEAEAAKLLENSFRLLNISFVNEMSKFLYRSGVKASNVIELASTKPYGFMPFKPGLGVGGHCIPVDPQFLIDSANRLGLPIKTLEAALMANADGIQFIHELAMRKLGNLSGKRILVVGITYKADTADVRESKALELIAMLRDSGASVDWHDDVIKRYGDETSRALTDGYDLAIIVNRHKTLEQSLLPKIPTIDCERLY